MAASSCFVLVFVYSIDFVGVKREETYHQVVDGHTANTTEPALHVGETDVEVLADAVLGDGAGDVAVQEVVGGDVDVLAAAEELVRSRHVLVEDLGGNSSEGRVSNPGAVVASANLTQLVGADVLHGLLVEGRVVLDRDLSGHTTLLSLDVV